MELKEIKKIIAYAKRSGVKSLSINGLSFELYEVAIRTPRLKSVRSQATDPNERVIPAPDPGPTLDQINQFIYQPMEETA